jgi:hypothetical protein
VNLDYVTELRDWTTDSRVEGADLAEWLLMRGKESFPPILNEALGIMLTPEIAAEEEGAMAEDSSRLGIGQGDG